MTSTPTTQHPQQSARTVGAVTLAALRRHPDRVAFTSDTDKLTYGGATDLIGRIQNVLAAYGLARGAHVAILSGNKAEAWCTAIAAGCSGLVVTYLHPMGSVPDQLYQLENSGAEALVVDPVRFSARGVELAETSGLRVVLSLGPAEFAPDLLAEAEAVGSSRASDVADPHDVYWLSFTGGTTGRPKGVQYSHRSVLAQSRGILTDFELPESPRYLAVAPITHVAGTKILPVLWRGGSVHLVDGFSPDHVLATIERERIDMALLVPTMIYALLDQPNLDSTDLSSLRLLLYGASTMSVDRLREGQERIGPVFAQLYGQSECYPISYLSRQDHAGADPALLASCGFPVHGVKVALLDDDDQPVADGERGEICVRGEAVMDGYWNLPDLTAETLRAGWLHTGDVGRRDDRGYVSIVDRKKDMIVTGGFNVFPREVEDALAAHPAVSSAAVYGTPDEKWGEAVNAAVVLRPGASALPEELLAHVKALKGSVQTPKRLLVLPELPMTAVGKIDKVSLRGL